MINDRITLVLGAGASAPYGFPLGEQLKLNIVNQISRRAFLDVHGTLLSGLIGIGEHDQRLREFATQLQLSHQPSIDAFLEDRPEFMEVGKYALAANLIVHEQVDDLMHKNGANETRKWYDYFLNLLGNREEFKSNNVSIITFNYDRSLEYFLYHGIRARFGLKEGDAVEYVASISIVHIYGQLGKPHFIDSSGRNYMPQLDKANLDKSTGGIRIIHESSVTSPELALAQELMGKSNILIFVGFGYHRKNLERLFARKNFNGQVVAGTFYGKERGEISRDMALLRLYTGSGVNSITIHKYTEDALGFLRKTNYLK